MSAPHPHQQAPWARCLAQLKESRVPHALLIHGEVEREVKDFTEQWVRALLCRGDGKEDEKPCDHCRACALHTSGNHPDFHAVVAEKEGGAIKVESIRDLLSFLHVSRHYDALKVVLIQNAEVMNLAAANSLLKMLEEPPPHTAIVLTSRSPFRLPATVRSRCQVIRLNASPDSAKDDEASARAAFCKDVNDFAAQQANLAEVVGRWHEHAVKTVHQWLLEMVEERLRREFLASPQEVFVRKLFKLYDRQKRRYLSLHIPLNATLLLESALVEWQIVCGDGQARHPYR